MGDHETRLRALERLKYLLLGGCLLGGLRSGAAATLMVFALSKHQEDMMTIAMPDSIYPQNLPPGYPAYLGYVDGRWPTAPVLHSKFPDAGDKSWGSMSQPSASSVLPMTVSATMCAPGNFECSTGAVGQRPST